MADFHVPTFFRSLAFDGRDGDGPVRGLHRLRPVAQPQSFYPPPEWTPPLRRLLGLLLSIRVQCQRHGQGGHKAGRQPSGGHGKEVNHHNNYL